MPYTDRQGQILELAAQGLSDKEIARFLGLSAHTVRTHLKRLYRGQGLSNRAEAVAVWVAEQHEEQPAQEDRADPSGEPQISSEITRPAARSRSGQRLTLAVALTLLIGLVVVPQVNGSWPLPHFLLGRSQVGSQPAATEHGLGQHPTSAATIGPSAQASPSASPELPAPPAGPAPGTAVRTQVGSTLQALINRDRAAAGLPPLAWKDCLAAVALLNAQRMAAQGYVSTTNGVVLDRECRLGSIPPAEDLSYWSTINDGAANSLFLANPVQRGNILGPFHYIGTAWAVSPTGIAFIAVEIS
jgi:DNA-binding CsgD family transcriptional regulator/uncharacterized protein YkwD